MTLPVVDKATSDGNLYIPVGATLGPKVWRWLDNDGYGVDLETGGITAELAILDDMRQVLHTATTAAGDFVITTAEIVAATLVSSAFLANGVIVAAGAQFITNGVQAGDRVILAGTTSNDTTIARVVSVDSESQITTNQIFTAEPAAGSVSVKSEGWFYLELPPAITGALIDAAKFEVEFVDPSVTPNIKRRPFTGTCTVEADL